MIYESDTIVIGDKITFAARRLSELFWHRKVEKDYISDFTSDILAYDFSDGNNYINYKLFAEIFRWKEYITNKSKEEELKIIMDIAFKMWQYGIDELKDTKYTF